MIRATDRNKMVARRRTLAVVEALRRTGRVPTMADKIATIGCIEELNAFRLEYLARNGALPTDVFRALIERRREIEGGAS